MLLIFMGTSFVYARNPIFRYFSRLFDETKAELAIGEIMSDTIINELSAKNKITKSEQLTRQIRKLGENTPRPEIVYEVYVIDSELKDEIPFPGGKLLLTSGLIDRAGDKKMLDFILARNLVLIMLREPMKLVKQEGIYAGLLNQVKLSSDKRDKHQIRIFTRDYIRALPKMNHVRADLEGLLLTSSPERTRTSAIKLMKSLSDCLWPVFPWNSGELSIRIEKLEKLKLPQ